MLYAYRMASLSSQRTMLIGSFNYFTDLSLKAVVTSVCQWVIKYRKEKKTVAQFIYRFLKITTQTLRSRWDDRRINPDNNNYLQSADRKIWMNNKKIYFRAKKNDILRIPVPPAKHCTQRSHRCCVVSIQSLFCRPKFLLVATNRLSLSIYFKKLWLLSRSHINKFYTRTASNYWNNLIFNSSKKVPKKTNKIIIARYDILVVSVMSLSTSK